MSKKSEIAGSENQPSRNDVNLKDLSEEQGVDTDNAAIMFMNGSDFLDEACDMLWTLLGGNNPDNHPLAENSIPEGYMGVYFQPDKYLFTLVKARFDLTLSEAKSESLLRTEEKNATIVDKYVMKTKEELETQLKDFINNSWKRIYRYFREPLNHAYQVDFFLPDETLYLVKPELTGEAKWKATLMKEFTSGKKVLTKLRDAIINNRKVKANKSLSRTEKTAATIKGAEEYRKEFLDLVENISNILPE